MCQKTTLPPATVALLRSILDALAEDSDDTASWCALADVGRDLAEQDGSPSDYDGNGLFSLAIDVSAPYRRARALQDAFALTAPTSAGRNRVREVTFASTYAEPGYSDPQSGLIALGNWNGAGRWSNDTEDESARRFGDLLESIGTEIEWSDEWTECGECGGIVRTSPDCHFWRPSYDYQDGDIVCHACQPPNEPADDEDGDDD